MSNPSTYRLDPDVREALAERARREDRPVARIVNRILREAFDMERFPGIVFVDSPAGRGPRIAGTRIAPWQVAAFLRFGGDAESCAETYGLTEPQVELALRYAEHNAEETERLIEEGEQPEANWRERYPGLFAAG